MTAGSAAPSVGALRGLYGLLEREVGPLFYDRDAAGIPRGWLRRVKAPIAPVFNTARVLDEYARRVDAGATP